VTVTETVTGGDEAGDEGEDEAGGEGEDEAGDEGDDEDPTTRCCVCNVPNSLCLDNECDVCEKPVCYKKGSTTSCSTRMNKGQKALRVRCMTCVAKLNEQHEAKEAEKEAKEAEKEAEEAEKEAKEAEKETPERAKEEDAKDEEDDTEEDEVVITQTPGVPMFTTKMPTDLTPIHSDALVKAGLNHLWFDTVSYIPLQEGLRSKSSRLQGT
jgi:hypothetical protein